MSSTQELLEQAMAVLVPEYLNIQDDSADHAGHAGARDGGGHYSLTIVSAQFRGLNRVKRHRLVYDAVGNLMKTRVHALAIQALAPEEC